MLSEAILALALGTSPAPAGPPAPVPWWMPFTAPDRGDTALAGAFLALQLVDWKQTREHQSHPEIWYETNPVLGPHPSKAKINQHFIRTTATVLLRSWALPRIFRKIDLSRSVGLELNFARQNFQAGVRIRL